MIKEAYVSFEVAKLLKEKGFNESCYTYYDDIDDSINRFDKGLHFNNTSYPWGVPYDINDAKKYIIAPTHQMAMKWLREEYKIAINIRISCKKTISYTFDIWDFEIIHPNKFVGGTIDLREQQFDFNSYEEAIEAALKYSLENLI